MISLKIIASILIIIIITAIIYLFIGLLDIIITLVSIFIDWLRKS